MSDEPAIAKAKGKRPAEDMSMSPPDTPTPQPTAPSTTPQIVSRHRHRRRNVATAVWGPSFPGQVAPNATQAFNVYQAVLRHPNLFFQFAIRLPIRTLTDLYAIDKEFHYRFNKYSTSVIIDYARYHACDAAHIFGWVMFPELCISDPLLKPMDNRPWLARDVPGLRWTKMLLWRTHVVRGILTLLALEGLRLPAATAPALMRFWLLAEMKTRALRAAFLADPHLFPSTDILFLHAFLLKLDMRIQDPVVSNGACELAPVLLGQKSLTHLYRFLLGRLRFDYDELSEVMITTFPMDVFDRRGFPWFEDELDNGVPWEIWGVLCREHWDQDGSRMETALEMLMTEGIRRGLNIQRYLLDFMLYGFVDGVTGSNVPFVKTDRSGAEVEVAEEEWPDEEARREMVARLDRRSGVRTVRVTLWGAPILNDKLDDLAANQYGVASWGRRDDGMEADGVDIEEA